MERDSTGNFRERLGKFIDSRSINRHKPARMYPLISLIGSLQKLRKHEVNGPQGPGMLLV